MKPENQSAFPEPFVNDPNLDISHTKGMELRDYFAAKALQGELASQDYNNEFYYGDFDALAGRCYSIADAMLKAR